MAPLRAHLELHIAVLVLAFSGILGKLMAMSTPLAICGRSAIAAVVLGLILRWRGRRLRFAGAGSRGDQVWVIICGVLLALHWVTFFQAVRVGSVAVGMLGLFTFPVMLTFLEPLVFRERLRGWSILHGLVVLAGLALVVPAFDVAHEETVGLLWGLASAVLYAVRNLVNRRLVHAHGSMPVMFWQVLVAAVVLSPAVLLEPAPPPAIDYLWLAILGVVCTAGGHTMFVASFRFFPVAMASIILTLEPVYATVLAVPIFDEWPRWQTLAGGAIILSAIAHETWQHARARPPAPDTT